MLAFEAYLYEQLYVQEGCREVKQQMFKDLRGRLPDDSTVLELGIGTGPNLEFYAQGLNIVGLEPNR